MLIYDKVQLQMTMNEKKTFLILCLILWKISIENPKTRQNNIFATLGGKFKFKDVAG